ncbi:hypothetical protein DUI70_1909 [Streptomyces albus]|nr:hypothetical protein DUI70_1909 [Streptomyces albus]
MRRRPLARRRGLGVPVSGVCGSLMCFLGPPAVGNPLLQGL